MINQVIQGDCLEVMRTLEDNSVDAVVTDPPYGLSFMGKKWDYDVPSQEIWQECLRVLKPGGYLLSFAGTRTQHRMAVRIEDAGFEIRDMIAWVYGSGFPKSLNIGKAVDKLQGNERELLGIDTRYNEPSGIVGVGQGERTLIDRQVTKGTSEWEGWGTALKPAVEPISVCQKPLQVKHIFAILIDDIWKHLLVSNAIKSLRDTQVKLDEVVNSVPENARTLNWEKIELAVAVAISSMSRSQQSTEKDTIKELFAQENANQSGKPNTQTNLTQTGKVEDKNGVDTFISELMEGISENTALLWKNISEELLTQANTYTTSMAIRKTIELKTLKSLLSQNTLTSTGSLSKIQPNCEPITVARKPLSEKTVAENCLKWGVGGINIDGCRVGTEIITNNINDFSNQHGNKFGNGEPIKKLGESQVVGRFPANLVLSYPENEYIMKEGITNEQKKNALKWIYENA